jgi:hypothetical protein
MSLDHRRIIEHPFPVHPHQALPPLPPARPRRVPTRALRLSANKSTCARESPAHTRVGFIPRLLAVPTRHHSIVLATRKQRIRRRHTCTGTRGVDAERGRARALLRVLARSRGFVDALECRELDYDGCDHGWRQLSGSHHHSFRHCSS